MPISESKYYKDKFIAFIDILGFKNFVEKSAAGLGTELEEILKIIGALGNADKRKWFDESGPYICPGASFVDRNLDFRLTQISDCVVISTEISPAGVINLLSECASIVIGLLRHGAMCRGYVTRGLIYHTDLQFIGPGYQTAFARESSVIAFRHEADERGTPFVEVDLVVSDYVTNCRDQCVSMIYSRIVKSDGKITAIFPFDRLVHIFTIGTSGAKFDQKKEHAQVNIIRSNIIALKRRVEHRIDNENPTAVRKGAYYLAMLEKLISDCDELDRLIDKMCLPFPARR